jgi:hypothetical protein
LTEWCGPLPGGKRSFASQYSQLQPIFTVKIENLGPRMIVCAAMSADVNVAENRGWTLRKARADGHDTIEFNVGVDQGTDGWFSPNGARFPCLPMDMSPSESRLFRARVSFEIVAQG